MIHYETPYNIKRLHFMQPYGFALSSVDHDSFVLIHFMYYCERGFLCTCSLVALPVSTVFQLANQDFQKLVFSM